MTNDLIQRQAVMDCFKKWQPYMATRLWEFEQELSKIPPVKPQESSITWMTGADGAKIAFWDVPVWKVTKICEILGKPQERSDKE